MIRNKSNKRAKVDIKKCELPKYYPEDQRCHKLFGAKCVRVCFPKAIELSSVREDVIKVLISKCNGCGACVEVCFRKAIKMEGVKK